MKRAFFFLAFLSISVNSFALTPLSDSGMRLVSAGEFISMPVQETRNISELLISYDEHKNFEDLLKDSLSKTNQAMGLSFDFLIEGVVYSGNNISSFIPSTTTLLLKGPESIENIEIRNLRTGADTPVIGDIQFKNITFDTLNIAITPRGNSI